jgi:hypothetical protein
MDAYATEEQLADFLPAGTEVDDAARLLKRASELLDGSVTNIFTVDSTTGIPTDAPTAEALRDACCAQVEFWLEVGEEHDIDGLAGTDVSVGGFTGKRATVIAPRAQRILGNAGLLAMVGTVPW